MKIERKKRRENKMEKEIKEGNK
jgi:hypothetical protein